MYRVSEISGKKFALMLSLLMLTFTIAIPSAFGVSDPFETGHEVVFVDHTGNTWTYDVTIGGTCHWVLAWCGGKASVLSWTEDASDYTGWISYAVESSTGIQGLIFGHPGGGLTIRYTITFDANYVEGTVDAGVIAFSDFYVGTVTGPIISFSVIGEITGTDEDDTWLSATATTDLPVTRTVTFYWYGPFEKGTSGPVESRLWDGITEWYNHPTPGTLTEDWIESITGTSPFVSTLHKMTKDHLGEWYVVAKLDGGVHEANDTVPVTLVPWFTSLPLALLTVVGAVFLLKSKGHLTL